MRKTLRSHAALGAIATLVAGGIIGCAAQEPDYSATATRVEAAAGKAEAAATKAEASARAAADAAARAQAAASKAEAMFGPKMHKK